MRDLSKAKKTGMANLSKYSEALGEDVPDMALNKIGRFRLQQVLRRKFGANWKGVSLAKRIMSDFEKQMKVGG